MTSTPLSSQSYETSLTNSIDSGQAPTTKADTRAAPAPLLIEFDKYVFKKDELIPANLDLRGAICIEQDVKHTGWLHKLMFVVQKIHQFLSKLFGWSCKEINPNVCHGSIIVDRVTNSSNYFMGNHSLLKNGVKTTNMDFHHQTNITHLIIYVPKNQDLRELMVANAKQTCYEEYNIYGHTKAERINEFATQDLVNSSFHIPQEPNKTIQKRTARAVADLLMGKQFLDEKGKKPRTFFCIPYLTTVLTATHLTQSLEPGEKELLLYRKDGTKRSRKEVAKQIYHSIYTFQESNSLSRAYWYNPIHQIDHRFLPTGYVKNFLDAVSTSGKLPTTESAAAA